MSLPKIGYVGMTHLGINSAVGAAVKGFETVCWDPDASVIGRLQSGDMIVTEPDLDRHAQENAARLTYTVDVAALASCDVVYVAPDVPTDDTGGSDLSGIDTLLDLVRPALPSTSMIVILSQVPPGFTRPRQPASPEDGPALFYQVETLVFGRAMERVLEPERYIVGLPQSDMALPEPWRVYLEAFGCPILPMRFESAELCKIAINCCLVASVSTANTLAELCENIGAVWPEIVPALRLDRRIGEYSYLKAGLGIAGGNLERDLATVCRIAESVGSSSDVVAAWIANSKHRKNWAWKTLSERILPILPKPKIGVLGLAYKENTHSIKNSPSLAFIDHLGAFPLAVHDPVVTADKAPHPAAKACKEPVEACAGADVVAIMTPWPVYKQINPKDIAAAMAGKVVFDPYCVLDHGACAQAGLTVFTLGVPVEA